MAKSPFRDLLMHIEKTPLCFVVLFLQPGQILGLLACDQGPLVRVIHNVFLSS